MTFVLGVGVGLLIGIGAAAIFMFCAHRRYAKRIEALTDHLERAALGSADILMPSGEDALSQLQDEIGKTVSVLHHARTQALQTKEGYARNLSYIAHQVKTPLSVISLAVQSVKRGDPVALDRAISSISVQIERLEQLQKDLLLMAKLDAGVLVVSPEAQDVFTLISMAADNVFDLAQEAGVSIEVVEGSPAEILVDTHWMCEALINVLKNCIEHAPANTTVQVVYDANPLYVEICITDEGPGFDSQEEECLFERFYTGKRNTLNATGLGLAFTRELIELQNGTIRAYAVPGGGARFDIRIYCHSNVTLAA